MNVKLLASKFIYSLRRDGVWATMQKCIRNLRHNRSSLDDFDLTYGTETGGMEPLWNFKISSPNACFGANYQASQETELIHVLKHLNEDFHRFTFIDIGCGKGRTLIVASNLGFKKIIGVEFVSELVDIARTNLKNTVITNADVLHMDAAEFTFPDGDLIVYLYNPFSQEVLQKVLNNLTTFLDITKKVYLIYKNPKCAEIIDSSGVFSRIEYDPFSENILIWRLAN